MLAGALALAGCGVRARLDALAALGEARATQASAGDRLRLEDGRELKLSGVAAPQDDAPFAAEAKAMLAGLALRRPLRLFGEGRLADGEGRSLAQVRVRDGPWLQGALLSAGAVRVRPAPGERALARDMLELEARARARRRGLWALDAYRVLLPQELNPWATGLVIVEGRVTRVGATPTLTYLDFARDWWAVASAEVPPAVARECATAGVGLSALEGCLVRLRGEARSLRVQIAAPEAMEVLKG